VEPTPKWPGITNELYSLALIATPSANFVEPSDNTDKPKYYFLPWLGSTLS
jgi:hypothetical protein